MQIKNIVRLSSRIYTALLGLCGALLLTAASAGCGVTEMNITLAEQSFTYDLSMTPAYPIPPLSCTSDTQCQQKLTQAGIVDNRFKAVCDPTMFCGANLVISLVYIQDLVNDPAFTSGFAQNSADSVRDMILNYSITNNANFTIDKIDVFVGPSGIMHSTDPGVIQVGSVGPVPAGGVLTDNQQQLVIKDGTPAHDQVVAGIKTPDKPFNFLMNSTVHFKAGDPLPHGTIIVWTQPVVTLLNR